MSTLLKFATVAAFLVALTVALYPTPDDAIGSAVCSTSATATATFQVGGPFDGMWKYTLSGPWDTGGEGLSHISFLISYVCDCCDIADLIAFDAVAGTSTGVDSLGDPCTAEYTGIGDLCLEDPTIPSTAPAIKFEQDDTSCEAETTGSGTWCFYSPLAPLPSATYTDAVVVKYGNNSCSGDLTGEMPDCINCLTVPTENTTWGGIKGKYEK